MRALLPTCPRRPVRPLAALARLAGLALLLLAGAPLATSAAPAGGQLTYLPMTGKAADLALANPSFEDSTRIDLAAPWPHCFYDGFTGSFGNQHPPGWTYRAHQTGETLPFETKMQEGSIVPAVSSGESENVHKCLYMLPKNEYPWAPDAVLLHQLWVYKAFRDHGAFALTLSQVIKGTPGTYATIFGHILGETSHLLTGGNTSLEDDHFVAALRLGNDADIRNYAQMSTTFDVPGKTRAWNRFEVTDQFPASGELTLTVIVQSNWTATDFFLDWFGGRRWVKTDSE